MLQHVLPMSVPMEAIWTLIWMQLFFGSLLIARNLLADFEMIHETLFLCKGFSAMITGETTNGMPFLVVGDLRLCKVGITTVGAYIFSSRSGMDSLVKSKSILVPKRLGTCGTFVSS